MGIQLFQLFRSTHGFASIELPDLTNRLPSARLCALNLTIHTPLEVLEPLSPLPITHYPLPSIYTNYTTN